MEKEKIPEFMKMIYSFSAKVQYFKNSSLPLKSGISINSASLSTLYVIKTHPGLTVSQLGTQMGLTKGAVSQTAGKLLELGLITKHKKEGNAKSTYLTITADGQKAADEYETFHDALYDGLYKILHTYSEKEANAIVSFFKEADGSMKDFKTVFFSETKE